MNKNNKIILIIVSIFALFYILSLTSLFKSDNVKDNETLYLLSSYENKNVSNEVINYAKKNKMNIEFKYMGDLDIVDELNNNSKEYDGILISNSMWLYMLNNNYLTSDSKSISISPVVFGIKKSKANELGLINGNVTNEKILDLIKNKNIKYVMSSVTQTNTGATAYLGLLQALAGNPEILSEEMLDDEKLKKDIKDVFSGVQRVSGEEQYLKEMFINSDDYEAIMASESDIISINKELISQNKEPLYLIYPTDGVSINDSTFAFINNDKNKEEKFLEIQKYLLSDDGQNMLANNGYRTWYGGTKDNSNNQIFNKDWGIDTAKYLNVTKFPSKNVITKAINLYIESLRKPTHVVFCLDYSGSMYGNGEKELKSAMNYILDYEKASKDKLQFSKNDKITVIPFASSVLNTWTIENGLETKSLIDKINNKIPSGGTALYDAVIKGLDILNSDTDDYTKTIIAMSDGAINMGTFKNLKDKYDNFKEKIPIYSITFGDAVEYELEEIAKLSNAKVFDGKKDLLNAFKKVRGYN